jgi:hypothetical protein
MLKKILGTAELKNAHQLDALQAFAEALGYTNSVTKTEQNDAGEDVEREIHFRPLGI